MLGTTLLKKNIGKIALFSNFTDPKLFSNGIKEGKFFVMELFSFKIKKFWVLMGNSNSNSNINFRVDSVVPFVIGKIAFSLGMLI